VAHRFEFAKDLMVDARPEQVWDAIATGRGMDSWFMGRTEIEPREGGTVRWTIGGSTEESWVTAWDPPRHFVNTGSEAPDGTIHRFEFGVEDLGGGRSAIRYVHDGVLGGDWEAEYEAMTESDPMYLDTLTQYLTHFPGRYATPVDVFGPVVIDRERAMATFRRGLGVDDEVAEGDTVRLTPDGIGVFEGVADHVSPHVLGVRGPDALYRFVHGFDGSTMAGHHLFADGVDQDEAENVWRAWLDRLFEPFDDDEPPG
jgi:uncharacterized protein YndB with AHSA1/START domain